jgi:hypothetical protein
MTWINAFLVSSLLLQPGWLGPREPSIRKTEFPSATGQKKMSIEIHFLSPENDFVEPLHLKFLKISTLEPVRTFKKISDGQYLLSIDDSFSGICIDAFAQGFLPFFEVFPERSSRDSLLEITVEFQPTRSICLEMSNGPSESLDVRWLDIDSSDILGFDSVETISFSGPPWFAFTHELDYSSGGHSFITSQVVLSDRSLDAILRWGNPAGQFIIHTQAFGASPMQVYQLPETGIHDGKIPIKFTLPTTSAISPQVIKFYFRLWEHGNSTRMSSLFATKIPNSVGEYQALFSPGTYSFLPAPQINWSGSGVADLPHFQETEKFALISNDALTTAIAVDLEIPTWSKYAVVPEVWGIPLVYGAVYLLFDSHGYPVMPNSSLLGPLEAFLDIRETYRLEIRTKTNRLAASFTDLRLPTIITH